MIPVLKIRSIPKQFSGGFANNAIDLTPGMFRGSCKFYEGQVPGKRC